MQMTGTVLSVDTRNQAETTMTDEASGATVIELTDAGPFAAGAGLVVIEGELYPYVSVDVDLDTITLAAPGMPFALPADSRVEVYPASPVKYALVDMGSDGGEAIEVLVPHFLVELLPDGVREPLMQEDVTLETSGVELVLTNVRAQQPAGGLIDTYRLSDETQALLAMSFADEASRDAIIEFPQVGMTCYVASTGLDYQYSTFGWQPVAQYVKKTANTSVVSSTIIDVTSPDIDLRALLIGGTYRVQAFLHYTAGSTGGFRTGWTFSGSVVTGNKSCMGPAPGSTDPAAVSQMRMSGHNYLTAITYGGGTTATLVHEDLLMRVDSTGVLAFCWAQATSSSTATVLSSASRLYIDKLADAV